ncbi:MAG: riboflavin biosynthesis protein RibD, partial [Klenkia sp.]|nr:riboflavin biosynthesis protein RibD [Klenkia sp.]
MTDPVTAEQAAAASRATAAGRAGSPTARELTAMARARALAWGALGTTSPNPAVGAVVLDAGGAVVGEGATRPPGGP